MTQYVKVALWLILVPSIVLDVHGVKFSAANRKSSYVLELKNLAKMQFLTGYTYLFLYVCILDVCSQIKISKKGFLTPEKQRKNVQELRN